MGDSLIAKQIFAAKGPIAVLGLGHVGLPTALGLAELGWRVIAADNDSSKVASIQENKCPFHEPGMPELLSKHIQNKKFTITDDIEVAVRQASVLFICVGTPQIDNGRADLSAVETLANIIAENLNSYKLIVEKSTVPARTGQRIKRIIARHVRLNAKLNGNNGKLNGKPNGKLNGNGMHRKSVMHIESDRLPGFEIASNPEFLQEGKAVGDFFHPDRVVCGVESDTAREILTRIYAPLKCPILFTDVSTAELIKHAANAFLATKISFINMVADICEGVNADVDHVANGIGLDSRIGRSFLNAGLGFGGYCFPKDLRAFIRLAEDNDVDALLLYATEKVNQRRIERMMEKIRQTLWIVRGKTIAVLGLAFKGGTDDIRESPSLRVVKALLKEGASLRMYDPKAMPNTQQVFPPEEGRISYCENAYESAEGAQALLVLSEWDEFRALDLAELRNRMQVPVLIDGRNIFDPTRVQAAGLEYVCMGRPLAISKAQSKASDAQFKRPKLKAVFQSRAAMM